MKFSLQFPPLYLKTTASLCLLLCLTLIPSLEGQDWKLTSENIQRAIDEAADELAQDPFRPAFHLVPPAGCMGDPNGGIYKDGWYHIFVGQHPFAFHPGGWYWAHARSQDLLHWERLPPTLTPPFELGVNAIGSGSTITTDNGETLAFYSSGSDGEMKFWRAEMDSTLNRWNHTGPNPILTLDHPGLPPFDGFWRDPFVFEVEGRTFLIACADLFEEDYVPVPIFEARDEALTDWEYKGILFTYPKHKLRNLEVPELRPLGDKWIFMASSDAPVDRVYYFLGEFDVDQLKFIPENEGIVDHSGHYYAQETILDEQGDLYLMAWLPGWDRDWLPRYNNTPLKNPPPLWNGVFALPRKLSLGNNGELIQQPVETLRELRGKHHRLESRLLSVVDAMALYDVLEDIRGDQLELYVELALDASSFSGVSVLTDDKGNGGLAIQWSGNLLQVDDLNVPLPDWRPGETLKMQIFVDKRWVEIFVNGGRTCVSRQLFVDHIGGDRIALTSLGGTGRLVSLDAWEMKAIQQ